MGSTAGSFAAGGNSFFQSYKRIILFCVVGVAGAIVDYGARSALLAFGVDPAVSRGISFVLGSSVAYSLNSRFTFTGDRSVKEKGRAALTYTFCFAVVIAVDAFIRSLLDLGGMTVAAAWIGSQAAATSVNFLLQKYYVFQGS
ncbi:GtrA family protein [Rhodococcus oryzae]